MRKRFCLWPFAWLLFGLLSLSAILFFLGQRERIANPSAASYAPSGTRALAQLFSQNGYTVAVDRSSKPVLKPGDFVVGFALQHAFTWGVERGDRADIEKALRDHIDRGGRGWILQIPEDFVGASKTARGGPRKGAFDSSVLPTASPKSMELTGGALLNETLGESLVRPGEANVALVRSETNEPILELYGPGKGVLAVLRDGTGATNRFLDQHQNAEFLLWAMALLNPSQGRIVILEALHGDVRDPGLLERIGDWAAAGWWQILFVLVVIAYTLGRRFGLPEVDRSVQRSGRELVDAYADTMRRSRKAQVALKRIVAEADRNIRRRFNLPHDLPVARRNQVLPEALAKVLTRAELAAESPLEEGAAANLVMDLEEELEKLDGLERPRKRRRRR